MSQKYNNEDLKTTVREHERVDAKAGSDKSIDDVVNGSMAPNMKEMKQLGKDMEELKTNTEVQEEGLVPDPVQNE